MQAIASGSGDSLSIVVGAAVASTSSPLLRNRDALLSEEVILLIRVASIPSSEPRQ